MHGWNRGRGSEQAKGRRGRESAVPDLQSSTAWLLETAGQMPKGTDPQQQAGREVPGRQGSCWVGRR